VNAQHRRSHLLVLILSRMARINEWRESSKSAEITGFLDSAWMDKDSGNEGDL